MIAKIRMMSTVIQNIRVQVVRNRLLVSAAQRERGWPVRIGATCFSAHLVCGMGPIQEQCFMWPTRLVNKP